MKVLIIDDDKFIRTIYASSLKQENINVVTAANGEKGLETAKTEKPNLILLDMILPGKHGLDVLKEIKTVPELAKIPVVIFSSLNQQTDIDQATALGAIKYLPKDQLSPDQIIAEIKKLLQPWLTQPN